MIAKISGVLVCSERDAHGIAKSDFGLLVFLKSSACFEKYNNHAFDYLLIISIVNRELCMGELKSREFGFRQSSFESCYLHQLVRMLLYFYMCFPNSQLEKNSFS